MLYFLYVYHHYYYLNVSILLRNGVMHYLDLAVLIGPIFMFICLFNLKFPRVELSLITRQSIRFKYPFLAIFYLIFFLLLLQIMENFLTELKLCHLPILTTCQAIQPFVDCRHHVWNYNPKTTAEVPMTD